MDLVFVSVFYALMLGAAFSDLLTMRIPNWLVLTVAFAFFVAAVILQMPLHSIGMSLLCALVVLIVTFTLFALNVIGGGDAKLAAAITLWMGTEQVLIYFVYASALGGVLTLLVLAYRAAPVDFLTVRYEWSSRLKDRKKGVPYGIALAIAAIVIYPNTMIASLSG